MKAVAAVDLENLLAVAALDILVAEILTEEILAEEKDSKQNQSLYKRGFFRESSFFTDIVRFNLHLRCRQTLSDLICFAGTDIVRFILHLRCRRFNR
jgi:hypothetical protein